MAAIFRVVVRESSFRTISEDRVAVHARQDGGLVVALADGAGGLPGGGAAADVVLAAVNDAVQGHYVPKSAEGWARLLAETDLRIQTASGAGETTAVVLAIDSPEHVVGASCGDSGALIVADDGSVDDLTSGQRRKLRLGSGRVEPVPFERRGPLGGTIVVATDGLLAFARPQAIARVVAERLDLEAVADELVRAVRPRGGIGDLLDDLAVVLVRAVEA